MEKYIVEWMNGWLVRVIRSMKLAMIKYTMIITYRKKRVIDRYYNSSKALLAILRFETEHF